MRTLKAMYKKFKEDNAAIAIGDLAPIAIAFVVIVIVIAVGSIVVQELNDDQVAGTAARNATEKGLTALNNLSAQTPLLATVVIFAVIIGVVVGFFAMSGRNK